MIRIVRSISLIALVMAVLGLDAPGPQNASRAAELTRPSPQKSAPLKANGAGAVDYARDVHPLLMKNCGRCHGVTRQEAGLRLDAGARIRKGSDDGPIVVAGKAAQSKLLERVSASGDNRMPPEGPALSAHEIDVLRSWINQGALSPPDESVAADPPQHWAFQRPQKALVPLVGGKPNASTAVKASISLASNPVDAFIDARLAKEGIEPTPPAAPHVWLRRVTLDLTGLPPTLDELRSFLADTRPDARIRTVDRLLASPAYGERWGRHWMDVWRYSDWYGWGNELRNSARHIWRWRDWIVESLNDDKPYRQMLVEMLAADEIDPTNREMLRATGFLARNYSRYNREGWLDETVEHTSKAFLGVTLNCARCHDHRYDPIRQADYYRFRAIFEPYQVRDDRVPGQPNIEVDGLSRVFDADLDKATFLYTRGNVANPDTKHPMLPAVPAALNGPKWQSQPVKLPVDASHPGLMAFVQSDELSRAQAACDQAAHALSDLKQQSVAGPRCQAAQLKLAAAQAALGALQARIAAEKAHVADPASALAHQTAKAASQAEHAAELKAAEAAVADAEQLASPTPVKSESAGKGRSKKRRRSPDAAQALAAAQKRLSVAREKIKKVDETFTPLGPIYPAKSSGRRLALAHWIASEDNPLTARVAINHIWLRHFGQPLVPTVFDFGAHGKPATHPELLDWLSIDLVHSGWNMKRIHRLIVLSETYARDSAVRAPQSRGVGLDPDNHLLWRMNSRRLESEAVRDSVLAVSGHLNHAMTGPEMDSRLGETTCRRSLYYRHAPEKFMTFLQMFDAPSPSECYRRNETIVPQQALALCNSELVLDQSRQLATTVSHSMPAGLFATGSQVRSDQQQEAAYVDALFERILCRPPSADERRACCEFLSKQAELLAKSARLTKFAAGSPSAVPGSSDRVQRSREDLAHVLLNHTEFVTLP